MAHVRWGRQASCVASQKWVGKTRVHICVWTEARQVGLGGGKAGEKRAEGTHRQGETMSEWVGGVITRQPDAAGAEGVWRGLCVKHACTCAAARLCCKARPRSDSLETLWPAASSCAAAHGCLRWLAASAAARQGHLPAQRNCGSGVAPKLGIGGGAKRSSDRSCGAAAGLASSSFLPPLNQPPNQLPPGAAAGSATASQRHMAEQRVRHAVVLHGRKAQQHAWHTTNALHLAASWPPLPEAVPPQHAAAL